MASSVVGALRVILGLDSAQFRKGLTQAEKRMRKFGASVGKAMKLASAAITTALVGISASVKSALKDFDKFAKISEQIGVPVEQLSALAHAADLSGVSLDQLSISMRNLSQNMVTVAQGSISDVARAFDALGISVQKSDGTLKSSTDIMSEIADKFVRMEDGATKTGLAMKIFGEEVGPRFIPLLNQGSAGIAEMTAEAERLGLVIDTKSAQAAERFREQLTKVNAVARGFVNHLTAQMLPTLEALANAFFSTAKDGDFLRAAARAIANVFREAVIHVIRFKDDLKIAGRDFVAVGQAIKLAATGNFSEAFDVLSERTTRSAIEMAAAARKMEVLRAEMSKPLMVQMGAPRQVKDFSVNFGKVASSARQAATATKEIGENAKDASTNFSQIGNSVAALIRGSATWRDVLADVVQMLAKAAFAQSGISGGIGGLFSGLFGFAHGGSFQVGGHGGTDSQLVAFKASPNETVSVNPPSRSNMQNPSMVEIKVTPTKLFDVEVERVAGPLSVQTSASMIRQADKQRQRAQMTGAA